MSLVSRPPVLGFWHSLKTGRPDWRKIALVGGVATFPLYVGLDALSAVLCDGYSYVNQSISELSAVGVSTRSLWVPVGMVYSVLMIGLALGIWGSAGPKRALRVIAVCGAMVGFLGLVAWPLAPMHQRQVLAAGGSTLRDTVHVMLAGADTLLFVVSMAFGTRVLGRRFRVYSIVSIVVVLVAGALSSRYAPDVQANASTPWLGVEERIAVFGSMLWFAVLAVALLRAGDANGERPGA